MADFIEDWKRSRDDVEDHLLGTLPPSEVETGTYPRFRRVERYAESPPAAETHVVGMDVLTDKVLVLATYKDREF